MLSSLKYAQQPHHLQNVLPSTMYVQALEKSAKHKHQNAWPMTGYTTANLSDKWNPSHLEYRFGCILTNIEYVTPSFWW